MNFSDGVSLSERLEELRRAVELRGFRFSLSKNPGATRVDLVTAREQMGLELPTSLQRFLIIRNGMRIEILPPLNSSKSLAMSTLEVFPTYRLPRELEELRATTECDHGREEIALRAFVSVANVHGPTHAVALDTSDGDDGRVISAWLGEPYVADVLEHPDEVVVARSFDEFLRRALEHATKGRGGFDYWSSDAFIGNPWAL